MLVCRETDSLGCVNCVEKSWNKMENKVTVVLADATCTVISGIAILGSSDIGSVEYVTSPMMKQAVKAINTAIGR